MDSNWTLSSSIENFDRTKIKRQYDLFIGGKWQTPLSKNYFNSTNPANDEIIAELPQANEEDVDAAFKAAEQASRPWMNLPGAERGKYLFRIARIIQEKSKELAIIESLDGGKPIRESRDIDIPLAASHFFYYAGWADKLSYAFPGTKVNPIGVAAQIVPWNFPLLMAAWKIAPALACGNTVVLKPAETTSLTALFLADIIQEAELPPGVVNIITGDGITGSMMTNHPTPKKLAFTGSTEVGRKVYEAALIGDKKVTLELGGKAANIIFEDASIDAAVEGIINGIYFNQGHVCCAGSRLFVQESVYDQVLAKLKWRMDQLIVGDPLDKNTDIGAINSKKQLNTIEGYLKSGVEEGAEMYQPHGSLPDKGNWCKPTLFEHVSQSHRIAREEIFGPVLAIQTFRTIKDAIEKANNTPYGLSAGVWTDKGSKTHQMSTALKAGVIWANTYNKFDPASPFGGFKESGFGREGGLHGLASYLNIDLESNS